MWSSNNETIKFTTVHRHHTLYVLKPRCLVLQAYITLCLLSFYYDLHTYSVIWIFISMAKDSMVLDQINIDMTITHIPSNR